MKRIQGTVTKSRHNETSEVFRNCFASSLNATETVKVHAYGSNIVGSNMLRSFAWNQNNVGICCVQFETIQTFRPIQRDATLLANNTQQCCNVLRPFTCALDKANLKTRSAIQLL